MLVWLGLYLIGQHAGFGGYYTAGLVIVAMLMFYQQFLIAEREPADCLRAFKNNHYLGAVVMLAMIADHHLGG